MVLEVLPCLQGLAWFMINTTLTGPSLPTAKNAYLPLSLPLHSLFRNDMYLLHWSHITCLEMHDTTTVS